MPKQFRKNEYDPDRYQRGSRKSLDALRLPVASLPVKQETANPDIRRDRVNLGTTKMGTTENMVGGGNATSELAEALMAGVAVAEASGKVANTYYNQKDADTYEAMQEELDELSITKAKGTEVKGTAPAAEENAGSDYNPDFVDTDEERAAVETPDRTYMSDEDYERKREGIYDRYKKQYKTGKYRRQIEADVTKNKLNLIYAPVEDKITAFNKAKFKIERDESYALMEDGLEQRTKDLENLYDQFYDSMQKSYGNDPAVMTKVEGLIGARRLESADQKARRRNKEAVSLLNNHLPRINEEIENATNDMVGIAPKNDWSAVGSPSSGTMYVDQADFAKDILIRSGLTEDQLDVQPEILEEFYELFGGIVDERFSKVEQEVESKIRSHLEGEIEGSTNLINDAFTQRGELPSDSRLEALEEDILDEYHFNNNPDIPGDQNVKLKARLEAFALLLPNVYFTGTAEENMKAAKERLIGITNRLGLDFVKDLGITLDKTEFDTGSGDEIKNMGDLQRGFSQPPRNQRERIIKENTGKNLAVIAGQSSLNEVIVNTPSLLDRDPSKLSSYRNIVMAAMMEYTDADIRHPSISGLSLSYPVSVTFGDFVRQQFNDVETLTPEDKTRILMLAEKTRNNPRFLAVELAREHLNGGSLIKFKNGIIDARGKSRIPRDANGNFVVATPEPTDYTWMAKDGHRGFIRQIGGYDAATKGSMDERVREPIEAFIKSPEALQGYHDWVHTGKDGSIDVGKVRAFWKNVYQSAGLDISDESIDALQTRFNPQALEEIIIRSSDPNASPFPVSEMDDIFTTIEDDNIVNTKRFRDNMDRAKSHIAEEAAKNLETAKELEPYVSREALLWAQENDIPYVNPQQLKADFENRGMQITAFDSGYIISTNQANLNARLARPPFKVTGFDGGTEVFQMHPRINQAFNYLSTTDRYSDNPTLRPILTVVNTLRDNARTGGVSSHVHALLHNDQRGVPRNLYTRKVTTFQRSASGRTARPVTTEVTQLSIRGLLTHIALIDHQLPDNTKIEEINPNNFKFKWNNDGRLELDLTNVDGFQNIDPYVFDRELGALLLSEELSH